MALLTVERNTPSVGSTSESEIDDLQTEVRSKSSSVEGFLATKSIAVGLGHREQWRINGPQYQGDEYEHLRALVALIRPQELCKLAVELESRQPFGRYIVIVASMGLQDTEENLLLGVDWIDKRLRVALVFPIWRDTTVVLNGDGGFSISSGARRHIFKPVSVQCMWAAFQALHKACELARAYNYYLDGLSHTWSAYYKTLLTGDLVSLGEWNWHEDVETRPDSPPLFFLAVGSEQSEKDLVKQLLSSKLKGIMMTVDLETVTSRQLRQSLQEDLQMDLREFKSYLDQEMIRIMGQMESASEILDYLYLGSEWNASNLEELNDRGIRHILNVTREIDNFFEGIMQYKNIRVYDDEKADLLRHWDSTYLFIYRARAEDSKVLVHCRRGISRSASTVIAYLMKENKWSLEHATEFVKSRRPMINPNPSFQRQLKEYEGIIMARHNEKWGQLAPQPIRHHRSSSDAHLFDIRKQNKADETHALAVIAEGGGGGGGDGETKNALGRQDSLRRSWAGPDSVDPSPPGDDLVSDDGDLEEVKASRLQTYLSSLDAADPVTPPMKRDALRAQSAPTTESDAAAAATAAATEAQQKRAFSLSPTNLRADETRRLRRVVSPPLYFRPNDVDEYDELRVASKSAGSSPPQERPTVMIKANQDLMPSKWLPPESPMAQTITERQCESVRAMVFGFESKVEAQQQEIQKLQQHRRQTSIGSRSARSLYSSSSELDDEPKQTSAVPAPPTQLTALAETGRTPAPEEAETTPTETKQSTKTVRVTRWKVVDTAPSDDLPKSEEQDTTASVATAATAAAAASESDEDDVNEDNRKVASLVKKFQDTTTNVSAKAFTFPRDVVVPSPPSFVPPRPHSNSPISQRRTTPPSPTLTRSASFSKESPLAERRRLAKQSPQLKMRRHTLASLADDDDGDSSDVDDETEKKTVQRLLRKFRKLAAESSRPAAKKKVSIVIGTEEVMSN